MIESLKKLARFLYPLKSITLTLALSFFGVVIYTVLTSQSPKDDSYIIPSFLGFLWCLLLYILVTMFPNIPSKAGQQDRLITRLKIRTKRLSYYFFGLVFTILTLAIVGLTLKMFGIWNTNYY